MSCEPLFGQAVQAPMVSEPNATPRVSVSHVVPSPTRAASANVKNVPNKRRIGTRSVAARDRRRFLIGRSRERVGVTRAGVAVEAAGPGLAGLRRQRTVGVVQQ